MARPERLTELHMMKKKWRDKDISPERTKVWTEPRRSTAELRSSVAVVYYISRNGQLQHPHFIHVPLSSPPALYLRDVIDRLNSLRGKGMASMYAWSVKRRYKNGFVWQDLAENDFIYPTQGNEYILKGSELMDTALVYSAPGARGDCEFPVAAARRHNTESIGVPTQAYEDKPLFRVVYKEEDEISSQSQGTTELSNGEISPSPLSKSSSETLETLMKADGRVILVNEGLTAASYDPTVKPKTASIVMQILSCGSLASKGP